MPLARHSEYPIMKPLTFLLGAGLLFAGVVPAPAQTSVTSSVAGASRLSPRAHPTRRGARRAATAGFEHLFNDERGRVYYDFDGGTFDSP